MKSTETEFGKLCRDTREKYLMSRAEWAFVFGVNENTVIAWELRGKVPGCVVRDLVSFMALRAAGVDDGFMEKYCRKNMILGMDAGKCAPVLQFLFGETLE